MSTDHSVVLFDGVCNFCNASVNWIIRRDKRDRFRFAPLQSAAGAEIAGQCGIDAGRLDSLVLVEGSRAFRRSGAALGIVRRLGVPWSLLYALVVVPPFVRDFGYDWFARNRYRWFGKKDECMVPTGELRERFLTD